MRALGAGFLRAVFIWLIWSWLISPATCLARASGAELESVALWQVQSPDPQARSSRSYLGAAIGDIDADRAKILKLGDERGVEVKRVEEGSPADHAGIQPGDVLLSYNGETILGVQQLVRLLGETPAGRKIKLQVWREGKVSSSLVTTGSYPSPETQNLSNGFSFPATATMIPRPLLVWRDILLGMEFEELDSQLSDYFGVSGGILIRDLERGAPAEKSGLKPGDVIVSVSHKTILTAHDFTSCLRKPGSPVTWTVMRNHKKLDVNVTVPGSDQ